jgi:hypothetical protein
MTRSNTRFRHGVSGNETTKWKPGQSGNPAGKSKRRQQFEEQFNQALITQGSPEEAAQLLWEAARKREPWAIQELWRRFAPEAHSPRSEPEIESDGIDYTKFNDEQLRKIATIIAEADQAGVEDGAGEAQTA